MDTLTVIKAILHDKKNIDPATVTEASSFDSLKIDSIDMIELICELEDQLDIDFGEPENLSTLSELISYIDSLRA